MSPLLPDEVGGKKVRGLNARFRVYRYVPGAVYRPHLDGAWPESGVDEKGDYVYDMGRGLWSKLTLCVSSHFIPVT